MNKSVEFTGVITLSKRVGFTGTREGMTTDQIITVDGILSDDLIIRWAHHGDCVGADADFHRIAKLQGLFTKGHPPTDPKLRAYCDFDEIADPRPYLLRNGDIVTETDFLIATPKEMTEQKKGGTWWTVRCARSEGKPIMIVWPDGSFRLEKGE